MNSTRAVRTTRSCLNMVFVSSNCLALQGEDHKTLLTQWALAQILKLIFRLETLSKKLVNDGQRFLGIDCMQTLNKKRRVSNFEFCNHCNSRKLETKL
jgi:hypothetical protein